MAEFITLLIVMIGQFGNSGVNAAEMSSRISEALLDAQPVPIEAVEASCELSKNGKLEAIVFDISGLVLDPLEIDHTTVRVEGVEVSSLGTIGLDSVVWKVEISDADLSRAMGQHTVSISDAEISTTRNGITVEGSYPLWKLHVPFSLEGKLVVENSTHLVFELNKSGVGAVNIPASLNRLLEQEINPVYDLAEFSNRSKKEIEMAKQKLNYKFNLLVETITPGKGKISISGSA